MIHAIGIVGYLFAAVCGCIAVKRTGNWNHVAHWFGWLSVFVLAWLAMPERTSVAAHDARLTNAQIRVFADIESEFVRLTNGQKTIKKTAAR